MKKIVSLIVTLILLCNCYGGKNYRIPISEGAVRVTMTDEHVIVERCSQVNGFGQPLWEFVRISYRNPETERADSLFVDKYKDDMNN